MAIFTAIAAAIGLGKIATAIFVSVSMFATSMVVGRIIAKRAMRRAGAGGDGGGRVQLPPATDNKLPVVYGSAFMGGPITDAYLTPDQKTMYYVVALSEVTDNGTISFGDVYYDGKKVLFGVNGAVTGLYTNNATPGPFAQLDGRVNGKLFIYLYNNGSDSPTNNPLSAYGIMPNWTSSYAMTNCAFAIVKVIYNVDSGTTGLGSIMVQVINTESGQSTGVYRPGTAIRDYLTNERYGCAVPLARVNTASLDALNAYSDETITYVPQGGGSATQARYRINGPLDTASNCLDNLQNLVDSCDSWLQYSELSGQWKVVINKRYPGYPVTSGLFSINDSNLVGGIQINPIDLNDTFNQLEVAYPNSNIKDQTDYQVLLLEDYQPSLLSPNEAVNRLNITYGQVNNAVQAKYLGVRRLLQSREDLVIAFDTDYSGIQIEAGDVIRVTHSIYGWVDKLFRVSQVSEEKKPDGTLGASIVAFEYNDTVYADNAIQDFIPEANTGLLDPNVFDAPTTPVITDGSTANSTTTSFNISSNVPNNGAIIYMDFNYGTTSNVQQHLLYRTVQAGPGSTLTAGANITVNVNDISQGNYYFSTTARNDFAGNQSGASSVYAWPGPKIVPYDPNTGTGGIGPNTIRPNVIISNNFVSNIQPIFIENAVPGVYIGDVIFVSGKVYRWDGSVYTASVPSTDITGNIVANSVANTGIVGQIVASQIANVQAAVVLGQLTNSQIQDIANTKILGNIINAQIESLGAAKITGQLTNSQIQDIANTKITGQLTSAQIQSITSAQLTGQITGTQITDGAISTAKLAAGAVTANEIAAGAVVAGKIAASAVTATELAAGSVVAGKIAAGAVTAGTIAAGAVTATEIAAGSITTAKIAAGAVTAGTIAAGAIEAGKIAAGAVTAGTIAAGAVQAGTLAAGAVTAGTVAAGVIGANEIAAGAITATKIQAGAVEADKLAVNSVTAGKIATNAVTAGTIAAGAVSAATIAAGAITTDKIAAGAVQAGQMAVSQLSAITGDMGSLTAGTITTATSPSRRVEISSTGNFPLWYGTGTKTAANALFSLDTGGNAIFAGNLAAAGGTISIDTGAIGANTALGILKGGQFVQCRDGVPVTFNPPFPTGSDARVIVTFVGGGLTYSNALSGPVYQKFEAFDITNTGFVPSLKLSEVTSGTLTPVSVSFSNPSLTATKVGSAEAYDDTYTAFFNLDVYPEYEYGFNFGYASVTLYADTGGGPVAISSPQYYGPGSYFGESIFGVVDGAGAGTVFSLVLDQYAGFSYITGTTLNYTTSSSTPPNVTATPTGVPDVTALAYLL